MLARSLSSVSFQNRLALHLDDEAGAASVANREKWHLSARHPENSEERNEAVCRAPTVCLKWIDYYLNLEFSRQIR